MNSKERCLAAIEGKPVDRIPVFPLLMFFAAGRAGLKYRTFATDAQALADAQISIYEKYSVDAITACCDAFRISADLAPDKIVYPEDGTPHLSEPIVRTAGDLKGLKRPDPLAKGSQMAGRSASLEAMLGAVGDECLVMGWVDMPFAEACSICGVQEFMMMMILEPALAHKVLDYCTEMVIDFANAQLSTGTPILGAGDAAASMISPQMYREFVLPYEKRICEAVHQSGALIKLHICGDTSALLQDMVESGADLFNVDHLVDFDRACEQYGKAQKCFKGNLDPVADMLQATPEQCRARALDCIKKAEGKRYMLSAGCEIPAKVTDEVFQAFCGAVGG